MKHSLWLLALLSVLYSHAQSPCELELKGLVIDHHDGKPLAFADVFVPYLNRGASANQDGQFVLTGLCQDSVLIVVSHVGCESETFLVWVREDSLATFYLEHHSDLLEMVEVEAEEPHKDIAGRLELSKESIEGNGGLDLASLLEDLEGVQALRSGGNIAKPMIHGLHSNRLVIVNNDTRIEGQQWGGEHAPEIDPLAMEHIEVVQGASSLRYGPEALAGVIIAKPEALDADSTLHGWVHGSYATNGRLSMAGAMVNLRLLPKQPLYFQLQGSKTKGGDMAAPDYLLNNTGSDNSQWQARLGWMKQKLGVETQYSRFNSKVGILSYAHVGNLTDLDRAFNGEGIVLPKDSFSFDIERPFQQVLHELSATRAWWRPRLETMLEAKVSRQYNLRQEFDNSIFSEDGPDLHYEITTWQADVLLEHRWSTRLKSEVGLAGQRQANTYEGRFFIPNFRALQWGAFAIQHIQFEHVELEAGLRYDQRFLEAFMFREDTLFEPTHTFSGWSGNVGIGFNKNGWQVSSNLAAGWRPPAINELYSGGLHHGAAAMEFGNESLREERAFTWTAQASVQEKTLFGRPVEALVTTYANLFDQFIYLVPQPEPTLTIRGAFPTFNYEPVDAIFRGVDFSASMEPVEGFTARISGEVVRANNLNSGEALLYIPADRYDLRLRYRFEQVRGKPFIGASSTGVLTQSRFPEGVDYANPPKGYLLFGAETGINLPLGRFKAILSARVENLANTPYRSYLNRLRYFADEPGRNYVFTLRIPFT